MLFKKGRSYLMKYMSLQEIAAACGGTYYGGSEFLPREVSSVVIDSVKQKKTVCLSRSGGHASTDIPLFRK